MNSLLGIDDIFQPLHQDFTELLEIKKRLAFCRSDGSCMIKAGIQHDVNELMKNLQLIRMKNDQTITDSAIGKDLESMVITVEKHSLIQRLIDFFNNSSNGTDQQEQSFLHLFLENLLSNLKATKSRYRYNEHIMDFALCLYILAGRNAYQFFRLNIPGAVPSLPIILKRLSTKGFRALEGEFRYDDMKAYMTSIGSKFAFCGEDATVVLRQVVYDSRSNSFVGFAPPLDHCGMPFMKYYQTSSISQLKEWFEKEDTSKLLNIHMIQPITIDDKKIYPFSLATYGTNGKYTSCDIIKRWYTIFKESLSRDIRILGYSTDADPRYLLAMRLVSSFFCTLRNDPLASHPASFTISLVPSWSWFYIPFKQLFFCLQDPTHVCTKIRNRLLSTTGVLMMGRSRISVIYFLQLIESHSKFKHNLVRSDVYPHDKQNYRSCEKLCVCLDMLKEIDGSDGTFIYVTIIHSVIKSFIDVSTRTADRIYFAWLSVFICRIWRTWLDLMSPSELRTLLLQVDDLSEMKKGEFQAKLNKDIFFMTKPAFYSLELNAHHLTLIALLVFEKKLPPETLSIFLFNSQICEQSFRLARAIPGTFSMIPNFSVQTYLNRQEKISMLNRFKVQEDASLTSNKLKFPKHQKVQCSDLSPTMQPEIINKGEIEEQANRAFDDAFSLLAPLGIEEKLRKSHITTMTQISLYMYNHFNKSTKEVNYSTIITSDESESQYRSDSDENSAEDEDENQVDTPDLDEVECSGGDELEDNDDIDASSENVNEKSKKMRGFCDSINPDLQDSYFLMDVDGKRKYLHKSTAIWYLTDEKLKSSSDRVNRVMEK